MIKKLNSYRSAITGPQFVSKEAVPADENGQSYVWEANYELGTVYILFNPWNKQNNSISS